MKRELDSDLPKSKGTVLSLRESMKAAAAGVRPRSTSDLSNKRETLVTLGSSSSTPFDALEEKVEKNRERNREHAKKTRLRKKEMIEGMKMRLLDLQRESIRLEQLLEESNTAHILLCLGGKDGAAEDKLDNLAQALAGATAQEVEDIRMIRGLITKGNLIDQLRQKVRADAAKMVKLHSSATSRDSRSESFHETDTNTTVESVGETSSVNPEESDRKGHDSEEDGDGEEHDEGDDSLMEEEDGGRPQKKSSGAKDVEKEKRERNRVHAKLTRDRKKLFTLNMQHAMQVLERYSQLMRQQLDRMLRGTTAGTPSSEAPAAASQAPVAKILTTPLLPTHPHAMYTMDPHQVTAMIHSAFAPLMFHGMDSYASAATAMWSLSHPFPLASATAVASSTTRFPSSSTVLPPKKKAKTIV